MIEPNSYSIGDAIDFVTSLADNGIKGIITSPPYNRGIRRNSSIWKLQEYDSYEDNLPEADYVQWQRQFVGASLKCVGDTGVVLYNIGRRFHDLREDLRYEIVRGFPVRQTIIWDRRTTIIQTDSYMTPRYELIYVLAGKDWRFPVRYRNDIKGWGDVWTIIPDQKTEHPCPFTYKVALRLAMMVCGPMADPFAGSGTVGLAAIRLGLPYYLNDISTQYRDLFCRKRLREGNVLNLDI